jgi:hypothetical protein
VPASDAVSERSTTEVKSVPAAPSVNSAE